MTTIFKNATKTNAITIQNKINGNGDFRVICESKLEWYQYKNPNSLEFTHEFRSIIESIIANNDLGDLQKMQELKKIKDLLDENEWLKKIHKK